MIEYPMIFLGGLLGSSHCIGMCGAFAVSIGMGSQNKTDNLRRQMVYSFGRIFTYTFLGALAGYIGLRTNAQLKSLINLQAFFCIVAGILLVYQGALAAGIRLDFWRRKTSANGTCLAGSLFSTFLTTPGWKNALIAGMLTGFLPCGLLYAFIALAVSSGNVLAGASIMAVFGAGTIPIMAVTGIGASLMSLTGRKTLLKAAAVCVVITGCWSVARGVSYVQLPDEPVNTDCPYCAEAEE